ARVCARTRYSSSFPGLDDTRYSLTGARTEFQREDGALLFGEAPDAGGGQREEILHLAPGKRTALGGGLNFHEVPASGHDHVHIHFRARVFFVGKIEKGAILDDADAGGGD